MALLLGLAAPAQAQQVLISNIGQTGIATTRDSLTGDFAQSFTTGGHEPGYTLSSVDLVFDGTQHNDLFRKNNPRITVTIQNDSGGKPGTTVLGTLTLPSSSPSPFNSQSRTFTFAAPGNGIRLEPSTTYFVVLGITTVDTGTSLQSINSNAENEGGADGFSIGDSSHSRPNSNHAWTAWHWELQIGINGRPVSILPVGPEHMPQIMLSQDEFVVEEPQAGNCLDSKVGDEQDHSGLSVTRNYGPVLTSEKYKVSLDRSPGTGKYVSVEIWEPTDLDRPDVRDGFDPENGEKLHTGNFSENARIHGISWDGGRQGRISIAKSFLTFTEDNWDKSQTVTVNIRCAQHDVTNPLPVWHFAFRHNDRVINPGSTHEHRLSSEPHSHGVNRKGDNGPNNTSLKIAEVRVADSTEPTAITGNVDGKLVLDAGSGFTIGGKKMIDLEFVWNHPDNSLGNDYDDASAQFAAFRVKLRTVEPAGHPVQEKIVLINDVSGKPRTAIGWYAAFEAKGHVGWVYGRPDPADSKYEWNVVPLDRRWNEVDDERVTQCVLLTSRAGTNGGRASRIDKTANPTCPAAQQGEGASAPAVYVPDTAVANVQITAVDDSSASVSWDAVEHATSYEVSWDGSGSQTAVTGILPGLTGTTATIQHNAQEAMTLTVTVTPEYIDGNGQVVPLTSLYGTATLNVGPRSLGDGGTNGGDGGPVRAGFGTGNGAVDLPVPVSHWRFEYDAVDWVGSSHGTEKGGVAFEANEEGEGVEDHALSLDGSDDYVDLSTHVSDFPLGDSTRSVTGWFKADADNQGQTFFAYGPNVAGKRFSIAADRTQVLVAVSGHAWGVNGLELQEGWHHVAVTYAGGDSDDILIYLDGELQSALTLAGSPKRLNTGTGPAAIGRSISGTKHYTGLIDDVRLYNVALSAEQVLALFEEHPQTPLAEDNPDEPEPSEQSIEADDEEADDGAVDLPDPVAHWNFDNNAVDGAGSSHGTVSGGAAFVANEDGEGVGSHALSLDGSNDYVDLDLHVSKFPLGDSTRSVTGWFKADTGSQDQTFFAYGPNVAGKRFSIAADRTQAVVGVSGYAWGVRNLSLTDGWHHIAVTFAGGDAKVFSIYLDGVLQSSELLGGFRRELDTKSGPASIGRSATGTKHYAGSIDDVRLYDVELSAEQVRALFDEHPQL